RDTGKRGRELRIEDEALQRKVAAELELRFFFDEMAFLKLGLEVLERNRLARLQAEERRLLPVRENDLVVGEFLDVGRQVRAEPRRQVRLQRGNDRIWD